MELKDLQSDLEAIGKLYGLLQCDGDDSNNVILGERSKVLLKDLLDVATEKVLGTHKKKISAATCSSGSENFRAITEFQPSVSPGVIKNMEESNDHELKSKTDEDSPLNLATYEVPSQQSRLSIPLDEPENRKDFCNCSEESSMNQQNIAWNLDCGVEREFLEKNGKIMKLGRSKEMIRQTSGFLVTPSLVGSVAHSSRSSASGYNLANRDDKIEEAANAFSNDVDDAVRRIESKISALCLHSKLADASKGAFSHSLCSMPTPLCSMVQAKEHSDSGNKNKLRHAVEPFPQPIGMESKGIGIKDNSNRSHLTFGLTDKDLIEDIMSKRRKIQHKEIGQSSKQIGRSNSTLVETDVRQQIQTASCYVQGFRVPMKQDTSKRPPTPVRMHHAIQMNSSGKEPTPKTAKLRPSMIPTQSAACRHKKNLLYQIPPEHRKADRKILKNKIQLTHQESEDSSTPSSSYSDSEAYSWSSEESADSYEASRSSNSSDNRNANESTRFHPTRKTENPTNHKSEKGGEGMLSKLKRLKNSLAVIFHHHHHHHYHPYDHEKRSKWTHLHKLFHPKNRHEVHDKVKKGRVSNVAVKHQAEPGHFHTLVERLMANHWHSKKSKPFKGGIGRLGNNQNGHKNKKTLHFWQMFQRQSKVKLPNRRQVRMGFRSRRKQIRTLKVAH